VITWWSLVPSRRRHRLSTRAGLGAVLAARYDVAPPVTPLGGEDVAIDVFHHLVYVTAATGAFELLDRR
jgi:hypothetical protein